MLKDYRVYKLNAKETMEYFLVSCAICFVLGMLFYDNAIIAAGLCIITPFFKSRFADYKCEKRKKGLLESFKDVLYSISASVAAGRQMPQAIADAAKQADLLGNDIAYELNHMVSVYNEAHGKIEDLLTDFGERSGIDEIKLFASSYRICKKSGGDVEDVCLKSAYLLIERIDYQSEVSAVLSEKKLDTILLMAMPPGILFFLEMSSYDYVALLYQGLEGRIIMTVSLFLMVLAGVWSLKIMKLDL